MLKIRKAAERGHNKINWLESWYTFSFAEYFDPKFHNFETLRVINEDIVQPGQGFPTHAHHDMEIITYVLSGALEHKDSMGNGSIIKPGDVQYMSAGTGVRHSEFNSSAKEPVHLLQIWILPNAKNLTPHYAQKTFPDAKKSGKLCLVISGDGRDDSIKINQDVDMYAASFAKNATQIKHNLAVNRKAWLQVARGNVMINGEKLQSGDGVATDAGETLEISGQDAEIILFDILRF